MNDTKMDITPQPRLLTRVETIRLRAAFIDNSEREKFATNAMVEKEKKLDAIRKKMEMQEQRLQTDRLKDYYATKMRDLVEMARTQVSDVYATQLRTVTDLFWRQLVGEDGSPLKNEDGSSVEVLMIPFGETERITGIFFSMGLEAGVILNREIVDDVLDSVSLVLTELAAKGKLDKQAELRIRSAMEVAGEYGLRALDTEIGRNLATQVELELERMGYKPGDKIPKDVRENLADGHRTTYASITDAISKTKFVRRKPKT